MTVYGCNSPEDDQWSTAYINITFKYRVRVTNQKGGHIDMKSPSLLIGPYGDRSFQMNFCVRESESTEHDNTPDGWWPPGHYMVYGTESGCPSGNYMPLRKILAHQEITRFMVQNAENPQRITCPSGNYMPPAPKITCPYAITCPLGYYKPVM